MIELADQEYNVYIKKIDSGPSSSTVTTEKNHREFELVL
jgi:hypothetical protein